MDSVTYTIYYHHYEHSELDFQVQWDSPSFLRAFEISSSDWLFSSSYFRKCVTASFTDKRVIWGIQFSSNVCILLMICDRLKLPVGYFLHNPLPHQHTRDTRMWTFLPIQAAC